jgi:hypothetical protein
VSDEQAAPPLTGRARSLANLKRYPKGETGNPSGRPKDIVNFGTLLMKEFYKTIPANLGGNHWYQRKIETFRSQDGGRASDPVAGFSSLFTALARRLRMLGSRPHQRS